MTTGKILMGTYELKVRRHDKTEEIITATTDWVEKNFRKAVLGQVQKVVYEKLEVMESKDKKRPRAHKEGFISAETSGVQCSAVDARVINRLKYLCSTHHADKKKIIDG
jgi:hypothetical protein